ncbi:hypothetical protein [uncultured Clostridium sp.]|uniref:hypothetical protein n=1 Tax=uncultured Clostridium sp. TaxID=59620 RepID=UPI00263AA7D1|nr:hypothetical protein [uncultured Clostridium sp.]
METKTKLQITESLIKSFGITDEDLIQDIYLMVLENEFNSYESIINKIKELVDNKKVTEVEVEVIPLMLVKNTKDDISDNIRDIIEKRSYVKSVSNAFVDMYNDGYDTVTFRKIFQKKYHNGLPYELISNILEIDISELENLDQNFLTYLRKYIDL